MILYHFHTNNVDDVTKSTNIHFLRNIKNITLISRAIWSYNNSIFEGKLLSMNNVYS